MIAEDIVAKIKFVNPEMHIFVDWNEKMIIDQAEQSKKRYESGKPLSPFDGVPVVIKDQLDIKGLTQRCGTEKEGVVATSDSVVVERLRNQGMIILGLVNMHPMGVGVTGINPSKYAGFCPNPFNIEYHPGASSSGTGVALAIGLAPVGIGTDGGGSGQRAVNMSSQISKTKFKFKFKVRQRLCQFTKLGTTQHIFLLRQSSLM